MNPFNFPIWLTGLYFFLGSKGGKSYRLMGVIYVCIFIPMIVGSAKSYYLEGAYPMLLAGGAVLVESFVERGKWRAQILKPLYVTALVGITEVDPIELIHRLTQQIPAPRQHLVRYYGWYSNRTRGARSARALVAEAGSSEHFGAPPELLARRRSWAWLLRRIFEVDPLLCSKCDVEMKIVSVLTEPRVVDRILRHVEKIGGNDPFQERAPPAA